VESLNAQAVLRRFRLEAQATLKTETRLVRLLKTSWRAAIGALGSGIAATWVTQVYMIGLLWLGTGLVLDAGLTPGELMSCYTLAGYLTGPITALINLNASIQEALIATDRLFELLDLEREKDQGTVEFSAAGMGGICFEAVNYRHAGRLATLEDVTVAIPAGKITALVGESGCGKSTLLALIQRLYQPQSGTICLGGLDLRHYRLESLRRHLAVVPQQSQLLSGTILENLAPGEDRVDMRRVLDLCRELGILEFIEKLPQGFFTHLHENGADLSGGQRQRLALVRALYLDAPILLLDEPNSALDPDAEDLLMKILRRLRAEGRTVVLAAHASWLVSLADQTVLLSAGKIVSIHRKEPGNSAAMAPASASSAECMARPAVAE
jgi:ATP-binding cassette subfamily B protein